MPIPPIASIPSVDLTKVVRPFAPPLNQKPDRARVFWNGWNNTKGKDTTGSDVPSLEWNFSTKVEVTTLPGLSVSYVGGSAGLDPSAMGGDWHEIARKTQIIQVKNEADPTQFVDVQAYDEVTFRVGTSPKTVKLIFKRFYD